MVIESENLLVERARSGEVAAIEQLLISLQPKLFRFSMQMCRHQEDAEDVMQETLLAMASSLPSFRGDSSIHTWMYTIARRTCYKQHRSDERKSASMHEQFADDSVFHPGASPETAVQQTESWARSICIARH